MPSLNNEIDILTVGGVDQDIRDTYTRNSIGMTEPLTVASVNHVENEVFYSAADRRLYRCLTDISIGTTFTPDVNVKTSTLSEMMYRLFAQSPEELMEEIAGYETGDNATKNYAVGDRFFWKNGYLYRVTVPINIGTAFAIGTNIVKEEEILALIKNLENGKDGKTVLTQNLVAGETTLTFTDSRITNNSLVEFYTNIYGRNPIHMTQQGNTVTVEFKPQSESMIVKLSIREE